MSVCTLTSYGCIIPLDKAVELVFLFIEAILLRAGHITSLCNLKGTVYKGSPQSLDRENCELKPQNREWNPRKPWDTAEGESNAAKYSLYFSTSLYSVQHMIKGKNGIEFLYKKIGFEDIIEYSYQLVSSLQFFWTSQDCLAFSTIPDNWNKQINWRVYKIE